MITPSVEHRSQCRLTLKTTWLGSTRRRVLLRHRTLGCEGLPGERETVRLFSRTPGTVDAVISLARRGKTVQYKTEHLRISRLQLLGLRSWAYSSFVFHYRCWLVSGRLRCLSYTSDSCFSSFQPDPFFDVLYISNFHDSLRHLIFSSHSTSFTLLTLLLPACVLPFSLLLPSISPVLQKRLRSRTFHDVSARNTD